MGADNFEPEMTTDDQTRNVRSRILQQAENALDRQRTVKKIFFKKLDILAEGHKGEELFLNILKVCRERFEKAEMEAMDA